ncbi:PREDICTED: probable endo-1,3(4)-beta-glucanase AFLA_105200 [Gekko japonicus]|uniref:Probable endo-1,3(4)-beta-glucanase AFLA_105200 n=1 Tax=Gekko japonicus TaxID=146911 RepID=A0ABM1L4A7_GEKJA|nr:PREDICTED: probable endo-1,3(4)-beta-glucanase AFLA_105200 [Gekko japonicus]
MAQAAEHLEAVPDPLEAVPDPQVLVTVDKVNDDEELISKVARDPQALVTFDETSEQEDPAAQETLKEADREPALKTEPLVTGNEIGELEELRLNEPLHFETETFSDRREEKEVLEDPGDFLSSQVPEDPSTSVTVGEIDEDNDYQPLVTLDEVTEADDDFPEGELNFVTVDGIGSKDEEEEKVTVTSTDMVEVVVKTVPETETATAVAETTEGLPWAAKQEETVILDDASPGEKVCPGENLPEEKKASEAQMEVAEKESVAAEIDTQETTLVETEKDEGGEDLEETLKEETEVEAQLAPPVAESTSKLTEQPDNQGSDMEDRQQPSEMESPEEDVEAKATEMDVEGCPEFATPTEQTGDVVTAAPAQEVSVGGRQTAGGEDPEARSERLGQDPGGKEESCSEVTPSQSSEKPEKECLGSRTASSTARPPQETPPVPTQYLLRPPKRPRRQGEDAVGATQSVGHLPGATARKQPRRQAPEPVARKEKGVVVPSTGRTTRAHPHGRGRHPHPQSSADVGTGGRRVSKPSAGTPPLHPGRRPGLRKEAGQGEGGDGLPQEDGAGSGEV